MDVLVAFASRHGATREIADAIGASIEAHGHRVAVRSVDAVLRVDAYDAVVLGSAIYEGAWLPSASSFVTANVPALGARPLWIFSSGALGDGDPVALLDGWSFPPELASLRGDLNPHGVTVFGGKILPSYLSLGDWLRNRELRGLAGDYRDWQRIHAWGDAIGAHLERHEAGDEASWAGAP